jgi:hypothetical protein
MNENDFAMAKADSRIVYCHCAFAQVVPADVKAAVLQGLSESGRSVEGVPDLCEMSAKRDPELVRIAASQGTDIIACYPRAVRWLFAAAGAPLPEPGPRIINMRVETGAAVLAALDSSAGTGEE